MITKLLIVATETSTMIKPIAPEVAKRFLEDYYHKLAVRTLKGLTHDFERRSKSGKMSKAKRRCSSFNQADLQRNKTKGSEVRETRTHIHRMSVDVGLFLGQKGLQAKAESRSPQEASPTQGSGVRELASISTAAAEREKLESTCRELENRTIKYGDKKESSKKLKRSPRISSIEDNETGETTSATTTQLSQIPFPGSRMRHGMFRRSLRKNTSDNGNSNTEETGSTVSLVENKEKTGGGRSERKSKLASSLPRRQWSWRQKKNECDIEVSSQDEQHSHPRSSSDTVVGQLLPSLGSFKEGSAITKPHTEDNSISPVSIMHTVGDSWSSPTPNNAFSKHSTT